jgi:uncharacterized protein (DUF1800 family)
MVLNTEREKVAHLLRRFALGASEAELDFYGKNGLKGAIDLLLTPPEDNGFPFQIEVLANDKGVINLPALKAWWGARILATKFPLQERLTLFWHDHFATATQKVNAVGPMEDQNQAIRANALGRFEDLLLAMAKDPAMIYWLDNQLNVKGKPNENFGREIMELFTIGIGHYSEKDVQECARAFTGWGYGTVARRRQVQEIPRRNTKFIFDPARHDDGMKEILGNKGPFNGDDVCGILAGHPETAKHLTKKFLEFFACQNPDEAWIERLAKRYRDNGLKTSVLVRGIMESPEFYSDKCARKLYKSPVDFCMVTVRQLGLGRQVREFLIADPDSDVKKRQAVSVPAVAAQAMVGMGMELFNPPDVAGWDWGPSWITTATMLERIKFADRIFGPPQPRSLTLRYPATSLLRLGDTPETFARALVQIFDAPLPEAKIKQLESAAISAAGNNLGANANKVALAVTKLIFASPEFQFS